MYVLRNHKRRFKSERKKEERKRNRKEKEIEKGKRRREGGKMREKREEIYENRGVHRVCRGAVSPKLPKIQLGKTKSERNDERRKEIRSKNEEN